MKLKQIASIVKTKKTIIISDSSSCQWISDGQAVYPIHNLPMLTPKNIFAMFDITGEQQSKFYVENRVLPAHLNFDDSDDTEYLIDRGKVSLTINGQALEPLETSQGLAFVNRKYLAPFSDLPDGYELYERTSKHGCVYIAVKSGFLLLGIIIPEQIINNEFINTLERWVRLSGISVGNGLYCAKDETYSQTTCFDADNQPEEERDL